MLYVFMWLLYALPKRKACCRPPLTFTTPPNIKTLQGTVFYPLSTQGQGPDRYNPIEQIIVGVPAAGGNYTITVRFNV